MVASMGLLPVPTGFFVVYTYRFSTEETTGAAFAGYCVWFGHGDVRNAVLPLRERGQTTIMAGSLAFIWVCRCMSLCHDVKVRSDSNCCIEGIENLGACRSSWWRRSA